MLKKVIGIIIICVTGGALLYLDCLNKQEKGSAEQIRMGLDHLRAQGKLRGVAKEAQASQQLAALKQCQLAADNASTAYNVIIHEVAPRKRGQIVMPPGVTEETAKILPAARAECQKMYDARIKEGV